MCRPRWLRQSSGSDTFVLSASSAEQGRGAPSLALVKEAFVPGANPGNRSPEVVEAMEFFLKKVVESVVKQVKCPKRWVGSGCSHMKFFGAAWKYEMATAAVLLEHFSDTTNIAHNSSEEERPKKKKRMVSKDNEAEISRSYYSHVRFFAELINTDPGLEKRMKEWDDHCFIGTRASSVRMTVLTNVMPPQQNVSAVNNDSGMGGLFNSMMASGFNVAVTPV